MSRHGGQRPNRRWRPSQGDATMVPVEGKCSIRPDEDCLSGEPNRGECMDKGCLILKQENSG